MRLYGPAQPTTSDAIIYTAGRDVRVQKLLVANTTGAEASLTLALGTTATAANLLVPAKTFGANSLTVVDLDLDLVSGEALHAKQGTLNALTITIVGELGAVLGRRN